MLAEKLTRMVAVLAASAACAGPCAAQVVRFVDADARPGGDGLSWATAFDGLVDALDEAAAGGVDQIWVAEGVYTPDRGNGDRSDAFALVAGLEVLGGFDGTETAADERDPVDNVTTLSGDFDGDDGPDFANNGENARQVVTAIQLETLAVLDGFTITRGNADFDPGDLLGGGGVYAQNSVLRVADCRIVGNAAGILANSIGGFGGGVFAQGGDVTIAGCRLEGNRANNGGALGVWKFDTLPHHVEIVDSEIVANVAVDLGGAAWTAHSPLDNQPDRSVRFIGCRFEGNSGEWAGAIIEQNTPVFEVIDSVFIGNRCNLLGGAMKISTTFGPDDDPARIHGCLFIGNESDAPGSISFGGGAVSLEEAKGHFVNCVFLGNRTDGPGGAIRSGNLIGFQGGAMDLLVHNCLFSGNTAASFGGAIVVDDNPLVEIVSSTIVNNSAGVGGGGISSFADFVDIDNTILWSNDVAGQETESAQVEILAGSLTVDFSIVQGLTGLLAGESNSGDDPEFVDADGPDRVAGTEDDDARLRPQSPAIDTGDNGALPPDGLDVDGDGDLGEPLPIDLDGRPRVIADVTDRGAYERPVAGDLDGDGAVSTTDLLQMLAAWGDCPPLDDCPADLDGSGDVTTTDLLMLLANWG